MHFRQVKQQGKLEALLDGESEWVTWFDSLLSMEGKVLLTSQKCCMSLPETGGWDWKSGVQRKENLDELATDSGPGWSCYVPSLPYKGWYFPTKGDISVAFPHFLWLLFPLHSLCFFLVPSHTVVYIVLPVLLKSEVEFSSLWLLYH